MIALSSNLKATSSLLLQSCPPQNTLHRVNSALLLFFFTHSQALCAPPADLLALTAVAGWQHMRKLSDLWTVPPLRVSVGNMETQYYFSHQQRDALNTRVVGVLCCCHVQFTPLLKLGTGQYQKDSMSFLQCHLWMHEVECSLPSSYDGANNITWHCKTNIPSLALN